jgi:hypothetical protein
VEIHPIDAAADGDRSFHHHQVDITRRWTPSKISRVGRAFRPRGPKLVSIRAHLCRREATRRDDGRARSSILSLVSFS